MNWGMGRYPPHVKDRPWFAIPDAATIKAQARFARDGVCALFSWGPVVGDPMTIIAGVIRVPMGRFVPLASIGMVLRDGLFVVAWRCWAKARGGCRFTAKGQGGAFILEDLRNLRRRNCP